VVLTLLWLERLGLVTGLGLMLLLAAGLYASYSQTSLAALFAAVLVIGLVAGDRQARRILAVTAVAVLLVGAALFASVVDGTSARRFTGDRLPLARITLPVYTQHPVAGVGIGSQPFASREEEGARREKRKNVSHTTPLTVAAELGTLGLLAYTAFLLGLGRSLLLTWRRDRALALALTGCLTALVAHSLFYGAFFEDPFLWGIAALAAAALAFEPLTAAEPARLRSAEVPTPAKPVTAPPGYPGR